MNAKAQKALAKVGARSMDEATLAKQGAQTIADVIKKALKDAGVEEATGIKVSLVNGGEYVIYDDSDPRLNEPASQVKGFDKGAPAVKTVQSARAGN